MESQGHHSNPVKRRKEVNLLLLGATGVGKSTFINAIANYLTYGSLEEALQSTSPVNLIPIKFTTTDDDYKPRQIEMGVGDDNENLDAGTSATQGARTYRFLSDDVLLRCIDTPGIGDVRGRDQDKVNFELIMSHLHYLKEINGICIFIDPNNPRLTEYFTFCIDELMMHLHKDACKNIVFMFCKSRSTNYKPGDALPTLDKLINERNYKGISQNKATIYCIDNESVRLLAIHSNGVKLDEMERANCVASWNRSSEAIARLLSHVSSIPPHLIKNTVCLNEAMNMIYVLIEPMLAICENIDKNIDLLTGKRAEVAAWGDGDMQKENFKMPKIVLQSKTINPRMVCGSSKCVEIVTVRDTDMEKYVTICHDDCYIPGMKFLNKISSLNRFCEVMNEGVCTKCWCSWKLHKHITCEYEEKVVEDELEGNLETSHDKHTTDMTTVAEYISKLDGVVRAQEGERDKIIDIATKLGIFLDQNSMRTNHDAIVAHMQQSIAFQEGIVSSGGSETKKKHLESLLEKYETQKKQLSGIRVFPTDINYMINTLYALPLNGHAIESSMNANLRANDKNALKTEIVLACRSAMNALHKKLTLFKF